MPLGTASGSQVHCPPQTKAFHSQGSKKFFFFFFFFPELHRRPCASVPNLGTTTAYRPSFGRPALRCPGCLCALPANAHGVVTAAPFHFGGVEPTVTTAKQASGLNRRERLHRPWPMLWGELLAVQQALINPGLPHLCQCRLFKGRPGTFLSS